MLLNTSCPRSRHGRRPPPQPGGRSQPSSASAPRSIITMTFSPRDSPRGRTAGTPRRTSSSAWWARATSSPNRIRSTANLSRLLAASYPYRSPVRPSGRKVRASTGIGGARFHVRRHCLSPSASSGPARCQLPFSHQAYLGSVPASSSASANATFVCRVFSRLFLRASYDAICSAAIPGKCFSQPGKSGRGVGTVSRRTSSVSSATPPHPASFSKYLPSHKSARKLGPNRAERVAARTACAADRPNLTG